MGTQIQTCFDVIYSTDLLYAKECWKLCGDAHCCSFSRYHRGRGALKQHLLLLPHEYEYMASKGYLTQYATFARETQRYEVPGATLAFDMLSIDTVPSGCPCTHDMRPATCRLYPMLPSYDVESGFTGVETHYGLEDEIEKALGMPMTCRIERLEPSEREPFLRIANAIASVPDCMFHVMAYQVVRRHAQAAIRKRFANAPMIPTAETVAKTRGSFSMSLAAGRLFDVAELQRELGLLAAAFANKWGAAFQQVGLT